VRRAQQNSEALAAVQSTPRDEEAHDHPALEHGGNNTALCITLHGFIHAVTAFEIRLSTRP
jgi:hypothetical protein